MRLLEQGVDAVGSVSGAGAVEVLDFESGTAAPILLDSDRRMAQPSTGGRGIAFTAQPRVISQPDHR